MPRRNSAIRPAEQMIQATRSQYRPEIDGLRAVAIIAVVLYHAGWRGFGGGYVGVDIFFVISGYVITRSIARQRDAGTFSLAQFWIRRARRILPALLAVIVFTVIASSFILMPTDFKNFGRSLLALSLFASNLYFWLKSGYFNEEAETMPLLHSWSLSVEEQFYILYPPLLLLLWRASKRWQAPVLLGAIALSLGLSASFIIVDPDAVFFLLPTRAWELLLGVLLAVRETDARAGVKWPFWAREALAAAGMLAVLIAIVGFGRNTVFSAWSSVLACAGAAAVIFCGSLGRTWVDRALAARAVVCVGLISYSLYLWHWPLLVFARYVSASPLGTLAVAALLAISVVVSVGSYRYIERPFRGPAVGQRPALIMFGAGILAAIGAGVVIDLGHGYPHRMPEDVLQAYTEAYRVPPQRLTPHRVSPHLAVGAMHGDRPPDIVLWGDSHAGVVAPVLAELANRHGQNLWVYRCIPVMGVYNVARDESLADSQCDRSNREMIDYLIRNKIKKVVFASFWTEFTEGREQQLQGAGQRDAYYADEETVSRSAADARNVFRRNFVKTVATLREHGIAVFIVGQVPIYRYWVPNQMAKLMRFGGDPDAIRRPLAEHRERTAFVDTVFAELASPAVHILDPVPYLCNSGAGYCYGTQSGVALYRDFNHLSYAGAVRLMPLLESIVEGSAPD